MGRSACEAGLPRVVGPSLHAMAGGVTRLASLVNTNCLPSFSAATGSFTTYSAGRSNALLGHGRS